MRRRGDATQEEAGEEEEEEEGAGGSGKARGAAAEPALSYAEEQARLRAAFLAAGTGGAQEGHRTRMGVVMSSVIGRRRQAIVSP